MLAFTLSWAVQARAEPPTTPETAPPTEAGAEASKASTAAAPDLVLLKNGSRYRGTIAELVTGEYVKIVVVTGETHRFAWDQIEYAGVAAEDEAEAESEGEDDAEKPARQRPLPRSSDSDRHDVRFRSDTSETHFFLRGEAKSKYRSICTAPCTRELKGQTYKVAVRIKDGKLMYIDEPVVIDEPTRLTADYRSRRGVRSAGALVLTLSIVALVGGIALAGTADEEALPLVVSAIGSGVIGGGVGLALLVTSDKVVVRASPVRK